MPDTSRQNDPDSKSKNPIFDSSATTEWAEEPPLDAEIERLRPIGLKLDQALQMPLLGCVAPLVTMIGPFPIERTLGTGGCAVVYLAADPILKRKVAIKVPHPAILARKVEQDRFVQEAEIVALLKHPNIVEIFQVGGDAECRYLVFEYCAGGSLSRWLMDQSAELSPRLCAEVILALANAVAYAHQQGVAHRDVNPNNVLLTPVSNVAGETDKLNFPFIPKLSDFGLGTWLDERKTAVQTQTGAVLGTLAYMAPEQTQANDSNLSPAIDIYPLGVMLYEMLTRVRPFAGESPVETLRVIREEDPISPCKLRRSIPRDLETICLKCIEKSPNLRYGSAELLVRDLELFLAGEPIHARRVGLWGKTRRWIAKRRYQATLTGTAIVFLWLILFNGTSLLRELRKSQGNEEHFKEQFHARTTELIAKETSEQNLKTVAQKQAEMVRKLSYIDHLQLISGLAGKRSYDAVQLLREWIPKSGEPDLRGFEWYHLLHACGGDIVPFPANVELNDFFYNMQLSKDGLHLFVSNTRRDNPRVMGWNVKSGQELQLRFPLKHGVSDFAINSQQDQLIAVENGIVVSKVDERSQAPSRMPSHLAIPNGMKCYRMVKHPQRQEILSICSVSGGFEMTSTLFWQSLETGAVLASVTWPQGRVSDVAVHPFDQSTIVAVDNAFEVYDSARHKIQELKLTENVPLRTLAFADDGGQLAVSTDQQQIFLCRKDSQGLWKVISETPSSPPYRHNNGQSFPIWNSVHFDPAGQNILFTYHLSMLKAEIAADGGLHEVARFSDLQLRHIAPLADNVLVAWMSDRTCGLWHPSRQVVPLSGHTKEAWSVAYTRDGSLLASGSDDETACLWNPKTGAKLGVLNEHLATITQVAFSPNDSLLATASLDGTVKIWNVASQQVLQTLASEPTRVRTMAWFADGKRLVTGDSPRNGQPSRILVWDVEAGLIHREFLGFSDQIQSVLVTPDQQTVIGASDDTSIQIFPIGGEHESSTALLRWSNNKPIRCATLLDQGFKLATGENYGAIRIWDLKSGTELSQLNGHSNCVLCLTLSPDGRILASGGEDRAVYLWDVETGRRLLAWTDLASQVNGLAFSPAGDTLTAALHDGSIKHFYAPQVKPIQFHR